MVSAKKLLAACACCAWVTQALDPFALSSTQVAQLQAAASSMRVPNAKDGCVDLNQDLKNEKKNTTRKKTKKGEDHASKKMGGGFLPLTWLEGFGSLKSLKS